MGSKPARSVGHVFGNGKTGRSIYNKNIGKQLIEGQGVTEEKIDPNLSRQQRRLARRRAAEQQAKGD